MRLPYADPTPNPTTPECTQQIYTRIATRRHPHPLLPLDLTLLHAPPIADGWNTLFGAIRTPEILPKRLLELSICRIAVLNGAGFEWSAHCGLALEAGVERRGLECVRDTGYPFEWLGMTGAAAGLDDAERIVLAYTDAMTRVVAVEGALFERVRVLLGDRGVVELTAAVAGYNCVSRFLVALDVGEMNSQGVEGWKVE